MTKVFPKKNENPNLPSTIEPSVVEPVKLPVANVDVSKHYFIFVGYVAEERQKNENKHKKEMGKCNYYHFLHNDDYYVLRVYCRIVR